MSVSNSASDHSTSAAFIKTDLDLLAIPGLSPRLRELYGRLRLHAGKDGRCNPSWATLAQEIGVSVEHPTTVYRLMRQLKALKLIDWKRRFGHHANQYQVLPPDIAFLQRQTLQKCNVSPPRDIAELQCRIDKDLKEEEKKREHTPYPQAIPSRKPVRKTDDCAPDGARGVRAPISRQGAPSAATVPRTPALFQEFIGVFLAAGKLLNDRDTERALRLWFHFDAPDHAAILEHLKRSVVDGTWSDARHTPMPTSYLASKAWTRAGPGRVLPRPPQSESKAEGAQRRAADRFLRGER